jgi:DNA-binding transcriptional LysR family regulator
MLNLNLEQLRNFVVTAKTQNLTKSAEQLYISQPTLSRMIAKLEEDLGVPLFDRKGKNIQLNAYGQLVLNFAERCFSGLDELQHQFDELKGGTSGCVNIGSSFTAGNTGWLDTCIRWFVLEHPDVRFGFFEMSPHELGGALLGRDIDIALSSTAYNEREIEWKTLYTEHMGVLMSTDNALCQKESVTVEDICSERIIIVKHDSDLDRAIVEFCENKGLMPNLFYQIDAPYLADEMLCKNMGISIITNKRYAADVPALGTEGSHEILSFRPLADLDASLPCRIGILRGRTLMTAAQHMYNKMCEEASK